MNLVLSRHGIWYSRFTYLLPCGRRKEIRRSLKTRCKRIARQKLQVVLLRTQSEDTMQNRTDAVRVASDIDMRLEDAIDKWLKERATEGIGLHEISRIKTYLDLLVTVVGNPRVSEVGRYHANQFKDALVESDRSPVTINNYLKRARMLFSWLCTRFDGLSNPFDGLSVRVLKAPSEQRQAYTTGDLNRLDSVISDLPEHKQWIILLGRYTGMRQGEVCQLYADNIVNLDGMWCIDVNDRRVDQRLKSSNSTRLIPVHSKLIAMGFLELVQKRQGGRLFPELKYTERRGYARYFQKWFGEWRKRKGLPEYHSLRHYVATVFKNEGVAEQFAAAVLGHSAGGITYNRYGKGVDVVRLVRAVELISS